MESDPEIVELLSQSFLDTLSPDPESRHRAEKNLSVAADTCNYGIALLRLTAEPSVDEHIRQRAAVSFKNHLKTRWVPSSEIDQIKTIIVPLILSATPGIQAQLTQALALIGDHHHLPVLLPDLNSSLKRAIDANDFASVNGILAGVNSLFSSEAPDLRSCFSAPLLSIVESISGKINEASWSASTLRQLIEAQKLSFRIFYSVKQSLNFFDLPEDIVDKWMSKFKKYLTVSYPVLEDIGTEGVSPVDELRTVVCEVITYYMEKEGQLFQKYIREFVEAVWSLLMVALSSPSRERLTVTAIKFLAIVSTSNHHALFAGDEIRQEITHSILVPYVMIRDEDEKLFEMNYEEFIRRDMEWSDLDTKRRITCELLKGISTERVSREIQDCLALFAENPAGNWKYKDCAIHLVVSLATTNEGGASISTDFVDVESFFTSMIVPELQEQDVNAFPMLKASALKFFAMLAVLMPKPVATDFLGDLVRFVGSDVNVVHSYAAICIQKLLLVKDNNGTQLQCQARYTSVDIEPVLLILMTNLFDALEKPNSKCNEYIMRCIMCVLQIVDLSSEELALSCFTEMTMALNRVNSHNPKNPVFNHCVYEAVSTLGQRACEKNPSLVPEFETCLKPSFLRILGNYNTELFPYDVQLLAQVVDLRGRCVLPPDDNFEFEITLTPCLWETPANVPALVRLFQSFLRQSPSVLKREGVIRRAVGIFNQLVSSNEEEAAFNILNAVIKNAAYVDLAGYLNDIWHSLFTRLQHSETPSLVRCVIVFTSFFLVKHGRRNLVGMICSEEGISFRDFLGRFWIPNLKTITTGDIEVKLLSVACTKLLCESPTLLDPAAEDLWGTMLDGLVTLLLSQPQPQPQEKDDPVTTGLRLLRYAGKKEEDPLKEIEDPKRYSVVLLAHLSFQFRGRFPPIIARYLSPDNQALLLRLCTSYKFAIV